MNNILSEIGLVILFSTFFGTLAKLIKQPLVLAYILAGIILGPYGFKLIKSPEVISGLSTLGIAFLLFLVGLELDLKKIRNLGKTIFILGLGQILFTGFLGYVIAKILGFAFISALYIAITLTFSSTVIVVKLLSEKNDFNSLYGKIVIGFLLVQDFIAILTLIFINTLAGHITSFFIPFSLLVAFLKGFLLFSFVWFLSVYILPSIFRYFARSSELLFLTGISVCFLLIFISHYVGFSIEIGAFLAGISLAPLPYNFEIIAKTKSLRDFFIALFFAVLGMQFVFPSFPLSFWPIIILSLFVLLGHPLVVMVLMGILGYRKRTSFLTGVAVAQISEFSLIIAYLGKQMGHIGNEVVSIVVAVGIITILVSTYLIIYSDFIYHKIRRFLKIFERKTPLFEESSVSSEFSNHIILFGCHRAGRHILETLLKFKKNFVVVDFDPNVIEFLKDKKIPYIYGDMGDLEILEKAGLSRALLVISTIPTMSDNIVMLKKLRAQNRRCIAYILTSNVEEALELYKEGADYVVVPYHLGGYHISLMLKEVNGDLEQLFKTKESKKKNHIDMLKKYREEKWKPNS